jgi:hypothetical protein
LFESEDEEKHEFHLQEHVGSFEYSKNCESEAKMIQMINPPEDQRMVEGLRV